MVLPSVFWLCGVFKVDGLAPFFIMNKQNRIVGSTQASTLTIKAEDDEELASFIGRICTASSLQRSIQPTRRSGSGVQPDIGQPCTVPPRDPWHRTLNPFRNSTKPPFVGKVPCPGSEAERASPSATQPDRTAQPRFPTRLIYVTKDHSRVGWRPGASEINGCLKANPPLMDARYQLGGLAIMRHSQVEAF